MAQTFFSENIRFLGFLSVKTLGARGDGVTDDRDAIQRAMIEAAVLGAEVYFPPGTYLVDKSPLGAWCLDCPGDNLKIRGVKGGTFVKAAPNPTPTSVALFRVNQRKNITFQDIGFDGNWGNVATKTAQSMNGLTLPQATIHVESTDPDGTPFPNAGTITIQTTNGLETVNYTGRTATSFTGCSGGTGTLIAGYPVGYVDSQAGINHATQGDPQNYGLFIRGSQNVVIDNCIVRNVYGDGIWLGQGATDFSTFTQNVTISRTTINMTARSGIAAAQKCAEIRVRDCHITNTYAQAWDTEPVGEFFGVHDVEISASYFGSWWGRANPARDANVAISIVGGYAPATTQADGARNFRVYDNTIEGSVFTQNAYDICIERNRILCDWDGNSYAAIVVQQYTEDVRVVDNYIYSRTNGWDAAVVVQYYGVAQNNRQPTGVVISRNRIHARNGNFGIYVNGTGGIDWLNIMTPGTSGVATDVNGVIVTVAGAGWTPSQWVGYHVKMGGAYGTIVTNTADTFRVTFWGSPLGELRPTPAAGAFEILSGGGFVTVDGNFIDCTDDGNGHGAAGIYIENERAGMRLRVRDNEILNPLTSGIHVISRHRLIQHLEIVDNLVWNNELASSTDQAINFEDGNTNFVKLILRGNTAGAQVPTNIRGLDSGVWLIEDGVVQRWAGWDSPNGVIAARVGSTFQRLDDGTAAAQWIKQSADGLAFGWVRITEPAPRAWDVDPGSGIGCPSSAAQWQAVIDAAGLNGLIAPPDALWLCQEDGTPGNVDLVDVIGGFTLFANGVGLLFQQNVSAWERNGVATTNNQSGRWESTDAGLPDVSVTPITLCTYAITPEDPVTTPTRMIMGVGGSPGVDHSQSYIGGATATRVASGPNVATAAGTQWDVMRPYTLIHDPVAGETIGYDNLVEVQPAFSAAVAGKRITIGGLDSVIAPSGTIRTLTWAWFSRIQKDHLRAIYTVLGWDIAW